MCYAIPGKVESIKDKIVTVDYFGEKKKAINEIDGLKKGDYIYAQGGFVIKSIPEPEADSILAVWKETFFDLQEVDLQLSRINYEKKGLRKNTTRILDRALEGSSLKKEDLLHLLELEDKNELAYLYKSANYLRRKNLSNSCCVHGIIEFSNYCKEGCLYCGISTHNIDLKRFRLSKEEILTTAEEAVNKYGFQALVLQSGEDSYYSVDLLCEIIKEIKEKMPVLIFISVGEIGIDGLKRLYDAGARGLLMRFETSNPELYKKVHPGRSLETRIEHIKEAYKIGYLIITGALIGLPGQTNEDIINDILLTKELNAEMYSFGPFVSHPKTPFAKQSPPDTSLILKVLSLCRIVDPVNAKILITTAFETVDPDARKEGLMAGANSVMLNVTPYEYKKSYDIYPDRAYLDMSIQDQIDKTLLILRNLGRAPTDLGVSS